MQSCNDTIRLRVRFFAVLTVIFMLAVAARLYYVQVVRHEYYYKLAREKYVAVKTTPGERGEIFDRDGNLLVGNMPCVTIIATPCNIPPDQDAAIAEMLSRELGIAPAPLYRKLANKNRRIAEKDASGRPTGKFVSKPNQYALLARNVPLLTATRIKNMAAAKKFKGLSFQNGTIRYYPKGNLLSNILGFTNVEHDQVIAVMGLEKYFDSQIRPESGKTTYERSRDGRILGDEPLQKTASRDGMNIYLTIVEPIQAILEEELDKAVARWNPRTAYAVMADPTTGSILAMAQRPSFDPNDRSGYSPASGRISIAEDVFEPGSIMKAVTVSGALDYGVVRPETVIDCENGRWIYGAKALTDTHGYGLQQVTGVIRKSSNIGTAKIALLMGEPRLDRTLRRFGFGSRTGLPLKLETRGILPPLSRWDKYSITRFGMGYGTAVSPVQMLRAYCALANGGYLPELRLVDRVEDTASKAVKSHPLKPRIAVFRRPETASEIVKMLITVTEPGGTALKAAIPGYHVAGKTGTARKVENGHYINKYYGSFIGFVPAEKPAFVLLVTLDEPHGSYYGGTVAGPTWKDIAVRTLRYMDVKPDPELLPPEKAKKSTPARAAGRNRPTDTGGRGGVR